VDKGLRDNWLEPMNSLAHFSVYSTCEGHRNPEGAGGSDHARIWLSLREELYASLARMWQCNRAGLLALISEHFTDPNTHYDFFHEQNRQTDHIRNFAPPKSAHCDGAMAGMLDQILACSPSRDGIGLHLDHKEVRKTKEMPDSVASWFDNTVRTLRAFDSALAKAVNK